MPQDATPPPKPSPEHLCTKIILVRHGSTKLNKGANGNGTSSECIRGWLDIPLSPKGEKEAQATGEKLKEMDFDGIIASNLCRAEHTADIISEATGVPVLYTTIGLRPWDVGEMAGKPIENCLEILQDYIRNKPTTPMPKGESFMDFKNRFLDELDCIRKSYPGKTLALISHHRNERLLAAWKASGGGAAEDIEPELFMEEGVPTAEFVRHTLAPAGPEPDGDDDDAPNAQAPPKKKRPATRPTKPSGPAKEPAKSAIDVAGNTPSDQAKVFKHYPRKLKDGLVKKDPFDLKPAVPIKKSKDGLVKVDPFDLKPKVPIKKGSQTWSSATRGSILEA